MSTTIIPGRPDNQRKNIFWLDKLAKKGLLNQLDKINRGQLTIIDGNETYQFGEIKSDTDLDITIDVYNSRFYASLAFGGSVGAGESYFWQDWDCSDLTGLIRLMLQNRDVLNDMDSKLSRLKIPLLKLLHWLNRNTRKGSRRNISAHYDLGNDLFKLFLDTNLMYSSAIYPAANSTLDEASRYKIDRICQKLALTSEDHVLEIGTGWGGFAIHAAQHYSCRITTTTISKEQYELAVERIEDAGLSDKITVLLMDYRDLAGQYDKIVSIEMIEAIGHQYLNTYFNQCSQLLKSDGVMLLQAITIADQHYKQALKEVDFIKRFIFPGCFIPSVTAMQDAITVNTDMKITNLEEIGPHYALTLHDWRKRFFAKIDQVKELGYPDEFIRMWDFYLCYCEGGFEERVIGDVQLLLSKPGNRAASWFG